MGIRCGLLIEDWSGIRERAKQVRYPPDVIRNAPQLIGNRRLVLQRPRWRTQPSWLAEEPGYHPACRGC